MFGAGAKSAGSINETKPKPVTNQGQTSLTGKNPFSILKASAIASISSAVFPNNFTNLPKATPPFLGQLESGKKYSLVLDLDETLIHNVEVSRPFLMIAVWCGEFLYGETRLCPVHRNDGQVLRNRHFHCSAAGICGLGY